MRKYPLGIIWFRQDLRLQDNPALSYVVKNCEKLFALFIYDKENLIGSASKWWLHHSLSKLKLSLAKQNIQLVIKSGRSSQVIEEIQQEFHQKFCTNHDNILIAWNRRYEPDQIKTDSQIKKILKSKKIKVESFNSHLLFEPFEILKKDRSAYKVFGPFWKEALKSDKNQSCSIFTQKLSLDIDSVSSENIESLDLLPKVNWDKEFYKKWEPGEDVAQKTWRDFLESKIQDYKKNRDFPSLTNTSQLSMHLHFGEISVRQLWQECCQTINKSDDEKIKTNIRKYISELGWREFAYYILYHFPETQSEALQKKFKNFPWSNNSDNPDFIKKWKKGLTGYPIVDAGMRQLWKEGWMHNRVRMIVASFLVKDLLISWKEGAKWFMDTLVDADLASNTLGWQWAGGCGADAAPYFRIFNPSLQSKKFDADTKYIKKYIPELKNIPSQYLHSPWEHKELLNNKFNFKLGQDYPNPIVKHKLARDKALQAFSKIKK